MCGRNGQVSLVVFGSVFVFGMGSLARAETINFVANIDGNCAGTGSSATGVGTFSLDTVTGLFTWHIEFSGLGSAERFAHLHGPLENACGSFGGGAIFQDLGLGSPKDGSTVFSAQRQQEVLDGLYYVNIHSEEFGSGEISGVINRDPPVPAVSQWGMTLLALLVLVGGTLALRRCSARSTMFGRR